MHIERIDILSSVGINPGFSVHGFDKHLTVIEGRNESGKSTLAGAIRELLWPDRHPTLQARGTFVAGDRTFHAFVDVHAGGWQGDRPVLPDANAGRCLIVGIGDLWVDDPHDHAIRQAMIRELHGGFDLTILHDAAEPRNPTGPRRDAQACEHALSRARTEAQALIAQESRLPDLRSSAASCRKRAARKATITDALERIDVVEKLGQLRNELSGIPDGALRVTGDEDRRLRDLRQRIDEDESAVTQEHASAANIRERLERLGLPADGVDASDLQALAGIESDLVGLERQLSEAQRRARELQAEIEAAPPALRTFDTETLARLESALNAAHEARERRARDLATVEAPAATKVRAPSRSPGLLAAVVVLLSGLAAAFESAWIAVGLAIVALGLCIAAIVRRPTASHDASAGIREQADRSNQAYQKALQAVRDIAGDDDTLTATLAIATAADRARRLDAIRIEFQGAKAGVESLVEQRGTLLSRASMVVSIYGIDACESAEHLTRARTDLDARNREHRRLTEALEQARRLANQCERRLDQARRQREDLLSQLGLSEDRLSELAEWLRLRERAGTLTDQIRRGEAVLQRLDASIASAPSLAGMDRAALEEERQACEAAGIEADRLHAEIGDIEGQIRTARGKADVGSALADLERAARSVVDARDVECAKAARRLILEQAIDGVQSDDLPVIIRRADTLMARFTARAYGLRIERGQPEVYDLRSGQHKPYEALSTGTRAQALLAMRLAGAIDAEQRSGASTLPLVLDEPLATTDDVRFEAIARAVFELAHDGRQLIYLTCDPGHAARLQRLAQDQDVTCTRLNLDEIRGRQATQHVPPGMLLEPKAGPDPERMSREAYLRAIGLRPLDPWRGTAGIDLYYLLREDLPRLHELRTRELCTVGQVLAHPEWANDPEVVRACRMARRLVRAWRRGRARPVTTRDIVASGAVSPTYEARVVELNDQAAGSARKLIDALSRGEAKGFRSNKIEQLQAYFEQEGLLPDGAPLSRAEVLAEALRGEVIGTSNEGSSPMLRSATELLDALEAVNRTGDEALADQRA